MSTTKIRTASH